MNKEAVCDDRCRPASSRMLKQVQKTTKREEYARCIPIHNGNTAWTCWGCVVRVSVRLPRVVYSCSIAGAAVSVHGRKARVTRFKGKIM